MFLTKLGSISPNNIQTFECYLSELQGDVHPTFCTIHCSTLIGVGGAGSIGGVGSIGGAGSIGGVGHTGGAVTVPSVVTVPGVVVTTGGSHGIPGGGGGGGTGGQGKKLQYISNSICLPLYRLGKKYGISVTC